MAIQQYNYSTFNYSYAQLSLHCMCLKLNCKCVSTLVQMLEVGKEMACREHMTAFTSFFEIPYRKSIVAKMTAINMI